ncbi:PREDICTED: protein FANTASTIC FOUR 1 [Nelumbo nucifera]|uniref:FAF domain-containing protein n=2 Tax=Nelumbo nucifera TaxID=4432 RepID=A0A822Y8N9_NELNU|nr:PREDICTED: protein FANTASTIC FOUR 1 [Nelumbo nucifera]DAD28860.1 TPA_asm: hypothetical protein HUJ06_030328 [Nelumbo nucifera]
MAACGSLEHMFENPIPENQTLIESLSPWNQIKSMDPMDLSSFTEIFGELHFKENPKSPSLPSLASSLSTSPSSSSLSSSSSFMDPNPLPEIGFLNFNNNGNLITEERNNDENHPSMDSLLDTQKKNPYTGPSSKNADGFSSKNSESLQHCTEGLGSESSDDVEDPKNENSDQLEGTEKEKSSISRYSVWENTSGEFKRSRTTGRPFPPPISCIGRSGKPWICFKSYRYDGRFILKEIRIPTREFLHARRENGRLKLHFVQPEGILDENEEEDEEEEGEGETEGTEEEIGDETVITEKEQEHREEIAKKLGKDNVQDN